MVVLAACGPILDDGSADGDTTGTSGSADTSPTVTSFTTDPTFPTTTTMTTSPTSATTFDTGDASEVTTWSDEGGCLFLCPPDGGGDGGDCDVWAQDCPEDEKCMPWGNDGGNLWNATRCSPIVAVPSQDGDPCLVEGSPTSGIDTCDIGFVCLWVDPATNTGTCAPNCSGAQDFGTCKDPLDVCTIDFEGTIISCLPECSPLQPSCPNHAGCYPTPDERFVCGATLVSPVPVGEACDHHWECTPGSLCIDAGVLALGCDGEACCASYCDVTVPDACGPGIICAQLYDSNTGFCGAM